MLSYLLVGAKLLVLLAIFLFFSWRTCAGVGILCDRATRLSMRHERRVRFEKLVDLRVKGKTEPVRVYRPILQV